MGDNLTNTKDPPPRIFYAARSKDEEPGKDSTGDQLTILRERFGAPQVEHTDHASGYRGNRGPGLEAAIADAVRLAPCELCVWHTTRLGRGTGRLGEARAIGHLLYELRAKGVTVRSVEDDEFATNEMLWGFASRMASKYSEDLSANVKRGLAARKAKGLAHGEPPYGSRRADDGTDQDDPSEAPVRDRILREHQQGRSYGQIARALNADQVPTRRGGPWSPSTVQRIVARAHGAERQPRPAGRLPKNHLLVRGALRCGLCSAAMLARSDAPRGYEIYVCRTHKLLGADACPMPVLRRARVDEPLLEAFARDVLDVQATCEHVARQRGADVQEARALAEDALLLAGRKRSALDRLDRDYEDEKLEAATYQRQVNRVLDELAAAEAQAERLRARASELEKLTDPESDALRRLRQALVGDSDVDALRAALSAVFLEFVAWLHDDGSVSIEPVVRPEAWAERDWTDPGPALHKVPLALENNQRTTSVPWGLFGPVVIELGEEKALAGYGNPASAEAYAGHHSTKGGA